MQDNSNVRPYSVIIFTESGVDEYPCFATNHHEAMKQTLDNHLKKFGPLRPNTRALVHGLNQSRANDILFELFPIVPEAQN